MKENQVEEIETSQRRKEDKRHTKEELTKGISERHKQEEEKEVDIQNRHTKGRAVGVRESGREEGRAVGIVTSADAIYSGAQ